MDFQKELDAAVASIKARDNFAWDLETTGLDPFQSKILIVALSTEDGAWVLPFEGPDAIPYASTMQELAPLFGDPTKTAIGWNLEFDIRHLVVNGVEFNNKIADGMVARWVCDENLSKQRMLGLKKQVQVHYNYDMAEIKDTELLNGVVNPIAWDYARDDGLYTYKIWHEKILPDMKEQGLEKVYWRICSPMVRVIADMELNGFFLDKDHLNVLDTTLSKEVDDYTERLRTIANDDLFNPGSGKQLSKLLFETLGLQIKRGHPWMKSGYWGTGVKDLERYKGEYTSSNGDDPVELVLKLRRSAKLLKTYVRPFIEITTTSHDGRIRASFRQTGTATGRLSSANPNLQNIPTEYGMVRKAFVAPPGKKLIVSDYSQLEMRVGGFIAKKRIGWSKIQEAYMNSPDSDLHEATRAKMEALGVEKFKKKYQDCRRHAKICNFSLFFGRSAGAFSRDNGIPLEEAEDLRNKFLKELYPEITEMQKYCAGQLMTRGYGTTITGRRRRFPEEKGKPFQDVWWPAWVLWNSCVQGCQSEEGLVLTQLGYVPIRELDPRTHHLITEHGKIRDYVVHDVGRKKGFYVETTGGYGTYSRDHRFGVYKDGTEQYVKLCDLDVGSWIMAFDSPVHKGLSKYRRCSDDEAYLVGALIGNGNYSSKRNQVYFCQGTKDIKYAKSISKRCERAWGYFPKWKPSKGSVGDAIRADINRKHVRERLLELGLNRVSGRRKSIPSWVFYAPVSLRKAFLLGLLDTDGGFSCRQVMFTSVSKNVAEGVWRLLESFGIRARLRNRSDAYRVYVEQDYLDNFFNVVGFTMKRKAKRLKSTLKFETRDLLPPNLISEIGSFILNCPATRKLRSCVVKRRNANGRVTTTKVRKRILYDNNEFHLLHRLRKGSGSRRSCLEMLRKLPRSKERNRFIELCNRRWAKITKRTSIGNVRMMDIESNERNKSYIGTGLLQHNSAQDIIQIAMRNIYEGIVEYRKSGFEFDSVLIPAKAWEEVKVLVQVHDELVAEAPEEYVEPVSKWIGHMMSTAIVDPDMVFPAEPGTGDTWEDAK